MGPFYCPPDEHVYLDLDFFKRCEPVGRARGPFAEAYVLAHAYGHHVQNLTGTLQRAIERHLSGRAPASAVELQADCYAGVWANDAVNTGFIAELTQDDIDRARSTRRPRRPTTVSRSERKGRQPGAWTHGSS